MDWVRAAMTSAGFTTTAGRWWAGQHRVLAAVPPHGETGVALVEENLERGIEDGLVIAGVAGSTRRRCLAFIVRRIAPPTRGVLALVLSRRHCHSVYTLV